MEEGLTIRECLVSSKIETFLAHELEDNSNNVAVLPRSINTVRAYILE